jgi:hypothetical protein
MSFPICSTSSSAALGSICREEREGRERESEKDKIEEGAGEGKRGANHESLLLTNPHQSISNLEKKREGSQRDL